MISKIEDLLSDHSFRKYVLNPTQGDNDHWENWIKTDHRNKELFEEAKQIVLEFYEPLTAKEFQEEAISFHRKINITPAEKSDILELYEQRRPKSKLWVRYAAIFLLLISSIYIVSQYIYDEGQSEFIGNSTNNIIKKEALKGHKLTKVFPDGTVVKLNSESFITYPEQFADDIREVTLHGEAYFDVAHYDNWPFIVHTQNVETKALGTSFNINAYPENDYINIALVNGGVEVKSTNLKPVRLKPMEMISINDSQGESEMSKFDTNEVTGWKDNIIVFKKASFEEVQFTLERWYDVEFFYDQPPVFDGGYNLTITDESIEAVLEGISSNRFNYERIGNKIFIN